jgi:hypothetical protein
VQKLPFIGQAMKKASQSLHLTVIQDSILLEYDTVSWGKEFPIFV